MSRTPANSSRVVVIGAGIVGCSLADELTARGWTDVTVLEQGPLPAPGGSTSHAPGPRLPDRPVQDHDRVRRLHRPEVRLPGGGRAALLQPGRRPGGRHHRGPLGRSAPQGRTRRLLGRTGRTAHPRGSASSCGRCSTRPGSTAASTPPTTGWPARCSPAAPRSSGPRARGARFLERHTVTGIEREGGRVTGVVTDRGTFPADHVVSAAGFWGPVIGAMAGVDVPAAAARPPVRHDRAAARARRRQRPAHRGDRSRSCASRTATSTSANTPTGSASAPTPTARCPSTPSPCPPSTTLPSCRPRCPSPRTTSRRAGRTVSDCCPRWAPRGWPRASTASSPSPPTGCRSSANPVSCGDSGWPRRSGSPTPRASPRPSPSG